MEKSPDHHRHGSSLLPIADKRVNVEDTQHLLEMASRKALFSLMDSNYELNLNLLCNIKLPFENAVFEGGGVKGIAYIGAMKAGLMGLNHCIIESSWW